MVNTLTLLLLLFFFFFPFSLLSILYIPLVIVKLQGTRVGLNSDKRLLISYIMHRYYENILCMHCAKKGKYTYIQRYEGIRTFADPVAANLIRACAIILQKCVILYMQWCIYMYTGECRLFFHVASINCINYRLPFPASPWSRISFHVNDNNDNGSDRKEQLVENS